MPRPAVADEDEDEDSEDDRFMNEYRAKRMQEIASSVSLRYAERANLAKAVLLTDRVYFLR